MSETSHLILGALAAFSAVIVLASLWASRYDR
jgi:hypothetical protein